MEAAKTREYTGGTVSCGGCAAFALKGRTVFNAVLFAFLSAVFFLEKIVEKNFIYSLTNQKEKRILNI